MNILKTISFLLLAIVAIYIIYWTVQIRYRIYVGKGLVEETRAYEQYPKGSTLRFLVVGDSGAMGVGARVKEDSMAGLLGDDYRSAIVDNRSKSGLTVRELPPFFDEFEGERFDLVLIQIGGNDIVDRRSAKKIEPEIREVLKRARALSDHVVVTSSGNFRTVKALPWGFRWVWNRYAVGQREVFLRVAEEEKVSVADFYMPYAQDVTKDFRKYYAPDRFHLSSDGYRLGYESEVKPRVDAFLKEME